ncbi:DUF4292 domain-containing protein [Mucilaginibacter sp. PAMB04168]|uniref:DUF4292 domain-containing protein n=1 Tax=Mucilaginibacter sp. PAMB04168 TaxID=3138567 RepID=UPI0031F682EC
MRRNMLNKLLLTLCLAALFGCKAKKQLVVRKADSTVTAKAVNPMLARLEAIRSKQTVFNTFSGRAKTKLTIDGKSNDVTLNIRIQHGKKIWVSITALLGIEVARAQITPDSVVVVNRLQRVYLKKPFSYINNYASRQVNYQTVESLLVGNAINELLSENGKIESAPGGGITITGNLNEIAYRLLVGIDSKVTQTSFANAPARQSLQVTNSQFIQADNKIIPSQINILSNVRDKSIEASLQYNRTEFNQPLEYPFSIPDGFEPAN